MNVRSEGIRALVSELGVPGAAVYVIAPALGFDDGVAAGVRDPGTLAPFSVRSPLRVASNTKTFVALAFTRLGRQGVVELDGPVRGLLPADLHDLLHPVYDLDAMTLRHLMTHTSGLRCHTDDPRFVRDILADPERQWTRHEQVARAVAMGEPHAAPGENPYYSDTGYVVLGAVLERVTGLYLGPALRSIVGYGTLGLHATWFELSEPPATEEPRARQYTGDRDATDWHPSMDLHGGGGLVSTVQDLARFFSALSSMPELAEMRRTPTHYAGTELRAGLFERRLGGRTVLSHAGYWGTVAQLVPESGFAIAAAVTQRDAAHRLQDIVDAITEELV